mgnify:CR=1 FL=1
MAAYIKYNTYDKEKTSKWKKDPVRIQNWYYVSERDEYLCANGRYLMFMYERSQRSERGYESRVRVYEC